MTIFSILVIMALLVTFFAMIRPQRPLLEIAVLLISIALLIGHFRVT